MAKIRQALTPVGSIQEGVPLSRVNTKPDDDDGGRFMRPPPEIVHVGRFVQKAGKYRSIVIMK